MFTETRDGRRSGPAGHGRSQPLRMLVPLLALIVWLTCGFAGLAAAQTTGTMAPTDPQAGEGRTGGVTVADLESLVGTIEDPTRREDLVRQLKALIAARAEADVQEPAMPDGLGARLLQRVSRQIDDIGRDLVSAAEFAIDLPRFQAWATAQVTDPDARLNWLRVAAEIAAIIAAGLAAEWVARALVGRPRRVIEARAGDGLLVRVPLLLVRTILDVLPAVAFAAAAFGVLALLAPRADARLAAVALIQANLVARLAVAAARMVLAPRVPALRVVPMATETAHYLFIWVSRFVNVWAYGFFGLEALSALGLPRGPYAILEKLIGIVLMAFAVALILQNRAAVAQRIRGPADGTGARGFQILLARLADVWHVLAMLYVVGTFAVWALRIEGGFEFVFRASLISVVVVLAARLLIAALHRAVARGFAINEDLRTRFPNLESRANRYLSVIDAILRGAVLALAALAILQVWGLDAFALVTSAYAIQAIGVLIRIGLIVVFGLVAWELIDAGVTRYLTEADAAGMPLQRSARARTLLPLFRKVAAGVLMLLVGLIAVSEIGIDIGPLLAGVGILGLAVGFGAQTLVKDVITGLFILMEDQLAVGDIVSVAGHTGVVEQISIRTIRLRDLSGTVHIVPFGEVTAAENLTKDFSYYLLDVGVAYREDTDYVTEVLREIAAELEKDEVLGPDILPPFEVLGVNQFADSAVIIRARIKTRPTRQWAIGREYNRRMKKRFDELGIEIPFPHQTIYFGVDKQGEAPPARLRFERAALGPTPVTPSAAATAPKREEGVPATGGGTEDSPHEPRPALDTPTEPDEPEPGPGR